MNTAQWTREQRELWARLCAFDLDEPGASLDFSRRLARENGWTYTFARRAVEEYKRFLFLAMSAGHPVTPSDEVDQAWHLHLVYTRSYWNELCADVLRAPLHHGPTRGGAREGAKFGQWYAQTRASYARFFGEFPPADIWPDAAIRFGDAPHFRRVNARRSWIIEKPQLQLPTRIAPAFLIALTLLGLAGAALGAPVNLNPWNWGGAAFLTLFWALCFAGLAGVLWTRHAGALPAGPLPADRVVGAYLLARLGSDGSELPIDAALANMVLEKRIFIDEDRRVKRIGEAPTSAWEKQIWKELADYPRDLNSIRNALKPQLRAFDIELERLGLIVSADNQSNIQFTTVAVSLGLLMLGGSKIIVGMSRDRPVGFLVVSCILVLIAFFVGLSKTPYRSRRGTALLDKLRVQHRRGDLSLPQSTGGAGADDPLVLSMALWGNGEMDAFGLGAERRVMYPPQTGVLYDGGGGGGCGSSNSSGGDSGGGDGGSGCGGGGCGGCGGG